jgi:hypothetical protein
MFKASAVAIAKQPAKNVEMGIGLGDVINDNITLELVLNPC